MNTTQNRLGVETLIALATNSFSVGRSIAHATKDGLQPTDIFILLPEFPRLKSIYEMRKQAIMEFADLTPEEAEQVVTRVSLLSGLPNDGTVLGKIRESLNLAARTYRVVDATLDLVSDWRALVKK